jgi:hypothetical protein
MLDLPEFSADRIVRRCVLWFLIFGFIAAGYFAYLHEHNRAKAAQKVTTPLKVLVNPESVIKDL